MRTLGERIRQLMQENDLLTEKELSACTGVPQPTINRILTGMTKTPRKAALKALANFFKVPVHSLIIPTEQPDSIQDSISEPGTPVPLLKWNDIQNELNKISIQRPLQHITAFKQLQGQLFALIIENNGFEPRFSQGTILIFQGDKVPKNRDYVILDINGATALKQILIDGTEHYFKSLDSELNYPILKLNDSAKIIGVLVQAISEFGD